MTREASFWKWLRSAWTSDFDFHQREGPDLHLTRIENGVSAGHPDVEGCLYGTQFWVELKVVTRPKRAHTPLRIGIRPSQAVWLKRRWVAGGNAWVLTRVDTGARESIYMTPGHLADQLRSITLIDLEDISLKFWRNVPNLIMWGVIRGRQRSWYDNHSLKYPYWVDP